MLTHPATPFAEFCMYDGLGLATLVREGQVAPAELVEAAIALIELHNPSLNAVVRTSYDMARAAAQAPLPDGPFAGVPFLIKDFLTTCAGLPTSNGTRLLKTLPRPHDSEMMRRYRSAGLILLGQTNTPEFALEPITEPAAWGAARNPWDLSRTPGGSSGGAGAAVGARLVPLAGASDGAGSIRIPASCCGVFGLKPSRGRSPLGPDRGEVWCGFAEEHVITRSVRDSAAILDATGGADAGAPYAAPPQARPFLDEVTTEPGRLRIAFTTQPFLGHTCAPECAAGVAATATLLEELGHEVIEASPTLDGEAFAAAYMSLIAAEARADIEEAARLAGRRVASRDFETKTYALGLMGKRLSAADYAAAKRCLQQEARKVASFFEGCDVLLTPTLAAPPLPLGALRLHGFAAVAASAINALDAGWTLALPPVARLAREQTAQLFDFMPYTTLFNVTGQPAMSAPLHWTATGLPIGMHFASRFGDEATLFRLAGQLERARPWKDRQPPL